MHVLAKQIGLYARRYWVGGVGAVLLILGLAVAAPAWAAPVASSLNQTVPQPTATSEPNPVATATPISSSSDNNSDNNSSNSTDSNTNVTAPLDNSALFGQSASGEPLTAVVSVSTLNVREGAGTSFAVVGALALNDQVTVLSRNDDGTWWYICCVPGTNTKGWISSSLVEPSFDRTQADTLLSIFGTAAVAAQQQTTAITTTQQPSQTATTAQTTGPGLPMKLTISQSPDFIWQGQTVDLQLVVSNPNSEDITSAELSDELPQQMEFVNAQADGGGRIGQQTTANGAILILGTWDKIPAGGSVTAVIKVKISADIPDGSVIDDLVAVRAANGAYTTGDITVGMPPVGLPSFQ